MRLSVTGDDHPAQKINGYRISSHGNVHPDPASVIISNCAQTGCGNKSSAWRCRGWGWCWCWAITSDLDNLAYRRNTAGIQDEQHVVAWRSRVGVGRRRHVKSTASLRERGPIYPLPHVETVSSRAQCDHCNLRDARGVGRADEKRLPVGDARWRQTDRRSGALKQIWRRVNFRRRSYDFATCRQNASIRQQQCNRVIGSQNCITCHRRPRAGCRIPHFRRVSGILRGRVRILGPLAAASYQHFTIGQQGSGVEPASIGHRPGVLPGRRRTGQVNYLCGRCRKRSAAATRVRKAGASSHQQHVAVIIHDG